MNKFLVATAVAGSLLAFNALAEDESGFSAEIGVVSNYLSDGYSQSDDKPAVQAGVEYSHESGIYAGVWGSTIDNGDKSGVEGDIYLGFGYEINDQLGLDLSINYATYTISGEKDEIDATVALSYEFMENSQVTASYTKGLSSDDDYNKYSYIGVDLDFESVADLIDLNLHAGFADDDGESSSDYSATVSKSDFEWAKGAEFGLTLSKASEEEWGKNGDDLKEEWGKNGDDLKAVVYAKYTFEM